MNVKATASLLRKLEPGSLIAGRAAPFDADALASAARLVESVRNGGWQALREAAISFGDRAEGEDLVFPRQRLDQALEEISTAERDLLQRTADRIESFAKAQLACIRDADVDVPGGRAGHRVRAVERAGCYAPGGRYPLPSTVLMTAVTARVAGVREVWVSSPRPPAITLAAAAVAGADGLLAAGGPHAIAAMAYGAGEVPRCDVVVGPGNQYVTAAKHLVSSSTRIDLLAGPSELVVVADSTADPVRVAADLLAQAEHDEAAISILIADDAALIDAVEGELARQLADLPTATTARQALKNGFSTCVRDLGEAARLADQIAPEHLQLVGARVEAISHRFRRYGALFLGAGSQVLGDYGAGPNHTLPTGGTARAFSGLSVFSFLCMNTWLRVDKGEDARGLADDAAALARLEGLEGHARAAILSRR